jgi:hypothetical protein
VCVCLIIFFFFSPLWHTAHLHFSILMVLMLGLEKNSIAITELHFLLSNFQHSLTYGLSIFCLPCACRIYLCIHNFSFHRNLVCTSSPPPLGECHCKTKHFRLEDVSERDGKPVLFKSERVQCTLYCRNGFFLFSQFISNRE